MADDLSPPRTDLYESDYLAWTEAQAAALRAVRDGDAALDYDNLAEEIEDLGKSEFYGCQSLVERIIEHLLKLQCVRSPDHRSHWRGEILNFRSQLEDRLTRTIRNRLMGRLTVLFDRQLKGLHQREMILDPQSVRAILPDGYDWSQITDADWYAQPLDD